eukprot:scaffold9394_cov124-Isochrysis_galbana.AAC.6
MYKHASLALWKHWSGEGCVSTTRSAHVRISACNSASAGTAWMGGASTAVGRTRWGTLSEMGLSPALEASVTHEMLCFPLAAGARSVAAKMTPLVVGSRRTHARIVWSGTTMVEDLPVRVSVSVLRAATNLPRGQRKDSSGRAHTSNPASVEGVVAGAVAGAAPLRVASSAFTAASSLRVAVSSALVASNSAFAVSSLDGASMSVRHAGLSRARIQK